MSQILIVDDDDAFRLSLQKTLNRLGYEVISSSSAKEALTTLTHTPVDLVISDIRMPEMDGIALTRSIKELYSLPVILITGFAEILDTQEAFQLGANEFLPKPIEREDLVGAIKRCLGSTKPLAAEGDLSYCKLGIEDFISGRQILFSIFIRLSENKFVKIAHKGEDLTRARIDAFKQKGIHFLYLSEQDFRTYVGFNLALTRAVRKNRTISQSKKLNLLRHTGEVLLEQISHDGVDQAMFDSSVAFVETAVEVLADDSEVLSLLEALNQHTDYLYAHCVGTSLYSVMLAQKVSWHLPTNKFKVSVGGLLHDVGLKEIAPELLMKPRHTWTVEEVKVYETHPKRGMEILSDVKSIPSDVLQIVKEHHEDELSQGFPSRLKKNSIHPMAKLISVADDFCDHVIKNPHSPPMNPKEALQQMSLFHADRLDPAFFEALMRLFHFVPQDTHNKRHKRI